MSAMPPLRDTALHPAGMAASVTPDEFRHALGAFATGVTIITARGAGGALCGLTANAFCSVSLKPPLVLACVSHDTRCYAAIREVGVFGVHILRGDQGALARGFARRGGDRGALCDWRVVDSGIPLLDAFHTALECALFDIHDGGDHAILVGRVLRVHADDAGDPPLMYYRSRLFPLGPEETPHPGAALARRQAR